MRELKIDEDKVLEASKQCPQAKEILKTLFPETFKEVTKLKEGDIYHEIRASVCNDGFYLIVKHWKMGLGLCDLFTGYIYSNDENSIRHYIKNGNYKYIGNLGDFKATLEQLLRFEEDKRILKTYLQKLTL